MNEIDRNKFTRFLAGSTKAVSANTKNTTAFSIKGTNKDVMILGWVMRHKPGLEGATVDVTNTDWQSANLHQGEIQLPCVASPWDKEPREFMFGSNVYTLKANSYLTIAVRADSTAILAGEIAILLKVREI